ncbi:hypothetical protein D0Z07_1295 [Hyphodiscus hymeniophilus]|uniref:Ubiquitin-like domain-containing protein n=1 Tax=Hyphodiscus hymeniophilus TaxID=353542 RepID=A0A9P7B0A5_9HELO|nr:hypothetical protein D0Z07_1295 [Hyphodiscus hymeniophilus]
MSEPAELPGGPIAPVGGGAGQNSLEFNLVVISPSNGVNGPLHFPNTRGTTSVKEVKAKIRDRVSSNPTDDGQRLIHHGRLLSRETETMLEVFGQELGNGDTKTLHLVLRDPPLPTNTPSSFQRAVPAIPQLQPRPHSTPTNPLQGIPGQQPLPGFQHLAQHHALHQADNTQQLISQRLAQLQQETRRLHQEMLQIEQRSRAIAAAAQQSQQTLINHQQNVPPHLMPNAVRDIIAQRQRERAADGRQGVQSTGALPNPLGHQSLPGQASPSLHRPDATTTYTREGTGPNGERWTMTVNETNVTLPLSQSHPVHHPHLPGQQVNQHPALDQLHAILRNADRYLPTQNPQNRPNNMERAASNPLPVPRIPTPTVSETHTGTATPFTTNGSPASSTAMNLPNLATPAVQTSNNAPILGHVDPLVYLLSSPNGPRALLLSGSDTSRSSQNNVQPPVGLPEFRNRQNGARRAHRNHHPNNPQPELAHPAVPHGNPGAGALAAQVGPIIWLIVRLVGFVWFFTAGNPSWSRWLMVSGLAVIVFIINTGVFNGLFEQLWGPVRRHVEALIPLAGPEAAQIPAINAAIPPAPPVDGQAEAGQEPIAQARRQRRGELDPAQVAAHLMEQHRQRNAPGWLMTQIRRAEHAMLLFLASLVPGVGERHIAAREAEANAAEAERQRLLDAAAATESSNPEAADSEHANTAASEEPVAEPESSGSGAARGENEESQAGQHTSNDLPNHE